MERTDESGIQGDVVLAHADAAKPFIGIICPQPALKTGHP
jgi:hypothetical protein